jgi:protein-tyrosine kinase
VTAIEAELRAAGGQVAPAPADLGDHLVSFLAPASFEADQYRTLRHLVERLHHESGFHVLAVTSAAPGEGKTLTTLNLAGALGQSADARVLLIDADLRRPKVASYLGLSQVGSPGLVDVIRDPRRGLAETVRRLEWANLSVLPAGSCDGGFYELFASPRFEWLLAEARRQYEFVLIDTPPVVPLPDARLIGKWVDGFFVIVAANKTSRKLLAEALNLLQADKVIGFIFNGARDSAATSGYYGYYSSRSSSSAQIRPDWRRHVRAVGERLRGSRRP